MGPSAGATATPTPTWAANPAPGPIAPAPPLASAASGTVPTESGRSGAERLVTGLIIVAVIGGAILVPNGGRLPSSASVATGEVPPAGSIWFGDTFDSDTLVLKGRKATVGATGAFSFVAHLTRSIDASQPGDPRLLPRGAGFVARRGRERVERHLGLLPWSAFRRGRVALRAHRDRRERPRERHDHGHAMTRRADPDRIHQARRAGIRNGLTDYGMDDDQAER